MMKFDIKKDDCLVVVGSGAIAGQCVSFLREYIEGDIYVFEKKECNISVLRERVLPLKKVYYSAVDDSIENNIRKINPPVIFSIGNTYLFKREIAEKFHIINYHNAILPLHPGRNAEAWSIFEQDKETGVTWHFVKETVDTGDIIFQERIPLDDKTTSLGLLAKQQRLAFTLFKKIVEALYSTNELMSHHQEHKDSVKMHYSWEIPNNGVLDLSWDIRQMSAFLRAMDYGRINILGQPKICIDRNIYTWNYYLFEIFKDEQGDNFIYDNERAMIVRGCHAIKLLGFRKV